MSWNSCHFRGCANQRADWRARSFGERTVVAPRYLYLRGKMIVLEDACRGFHLLARGGVWTKHALVNTRRPFEYTQLQNDELRHRCLQHAYVRRPQVKLKCPHVGGKLACVRGVVCLHRFIDWDLLLGYYVLGLLPPTPTTEIPKSLKRDNLCKPYKDLAW